MLLSALAATLVFAWCYSQSFVGNLSSDGANYLAVGRNWAEGAGLMSPAALPGLIDVVPTDSRGQALVVHAPLWPLLIGVWFSLFGASDHSFLVLAWALYSCIVVETHLLARSVTSRGVLVAAATAAAALSPLLLQAAFIGSASLLQGVLVTAVLLTALKGPSFRSAIATGIWLGLACVARENSLFVLSSVAVLWLFRKPQTGEAGRSPKARVLWLLVLVACIASIPVLMESYRKASILGRWDAPILRLTFLYHTAIGNLGWFFIYDHPMLHTSPLSYFLARPSELIGKVAFQLNVAFFQQTVPALLSLSPWFVPPLLPMRLRVEGALFAAAALVGLSLQTAVASVSFLHATYYYAWLPALFVLIACFANTWLAELPPGWRWTPRTIASVVLLAYALAPIALNLKSVLQANPRLTEADYEFSARELHRLTQWIEDETPTGSMLIGPYAHLIGWRTRRTILLYSWHPDYVVADTPMWRTILKRFPAQFIIVQTSPGGSIPALPGGFEPRSRLRLEPERILHLYARQTR